MKSTYLITIEVKSDSDPTGWDWPTLLDLDDRDDVRIISSERWEE